jgi:hypothetical protein
MHMQDQVNNCLETTTFPWLTEPPANEGTAAAPAVQPKVPAHLKSAPQAAGNPKYPKSLRTTRSPWAAMALAQGNGQGKPSKRPEAKPSPDEGRRPGPRVILFCAGGITYSETRAAYEVMKETGREVIIGRRGVRACVPRGGTYGMRGSAQSPLDTQTARASQAPPLCTAPTSSWR